MEVVMKGEAWEEEVVWLYVAAGLRTLLCAHGGKWLLCESARGQDTGGDLPRQFNDPFGETSNPMWAAALERFVFYGQDSW